MNWTGADRERIAGYLKSGFSASQIAGKFYGKSRNAVIGVVRRDPLLRDIGFKRSPRCRHDGPKPERTRKPIGRPRKVVEPKPKPKPKPEPVELTAPHIAGQPLEYLARLQCRFAVNHAAVREMHLFCGLPTESGSWCPYHRSIVYRPRLEP